MGELALVAEYGLRLNCSKMVVYVPAGDNFSGDLSGFRQLGIKVDFSGNVAFMKVPIVGSTEFFSEWVKQK